MRLVCWCRHSPQPPPNQLFNVILVRIRKIDRVKTYFLSNKMTMPAKEEINSELNHLRHVESCFLTVYVSLMVTGLTLYLTLINNEIYQKSSLIVFIFSLLFSINHLYAILINNITKRINAFLWDIAYFLMLIVLFITTTFTQIIISFSTKYPSIDFRFIALIGSLILIFLGAVIIQSYISKKVIPTFRKKIFPVLSYKKIIRNPLENQ